MSSGDPKLRIANDENTYFEFIPLSDKQFFIRFYIMPTAFISSGLFNVLAENQISFQGVTEEILLFSYDDNMVHYSIRINTSGELQIGSPNLCAIVPAVPLIGQILYTLENSQSYTIGSAATKITSTKNMADYFTDYALMMRPLIKDPVLQTTDENHNIYTLLLPEQANSVLATTTSKQILQNKIITNPTINGYPFNDCDSLYSVIDLLSTIRF